jgi:hypothetical protein
MRISLSLVCAAGLLTVFISVKASADGSGRFSGQWIAVFFDGTFEVAKGCRFADVLTRTYDLSRNDDGRATGQYVVQQHRLWIGKNDKHCEIPDHEPKMDSYYRSDSWSLIGSLDQVGRLHLSAVHLACLGQCERFAAASQFETILEFDGENIIDGIGGPPDKLLVFEDQARHDRREAEAAKAFRPLLQPLIDRDCNEFYKSSLDLGVKLLIDPPQDIYCRVQAPTVSILSRLTVSHPSFSIAASNGVALSIFADAGTVPVLLADDAIVQEFLSSADGSATLMVTMVLRLQPNGSWRTRLIL